MRSVKHPITALLVLLTLSFAGVVMAAPYRTEVSYSQSETDSADTFNFGEEIESDTKLLEFFYFLKPVVVKNTPWGESAFVSRSGYWGGTFGEADSENGEVVDIKSVNARFVTQSNLVFGLSYKDSDSDLVFSGIEEKAIEFGAYIGDRSLATVTYQKSEGSTDSKTWKWLYKQLFNGARPNGYLAYEIGLDYIDEYTTSGYQLSLSGTHYLSSKFSLGAFVSYIDKENVGSSRVALNTEYFFTEKLSSRIEISRENSANSFVSDGGFYADTVDLRVSARF